MVTKLRTINHDLFIRRCLACGYDGALLRGGAAEHCVRCGCDLSLRPARSYAEMEGLVGQPLTLDSPQWSGEREQRMVQRWLVFLFMAIVFIVAVLSLTLAALP